MICRYLSYDQDRLIRGPFVSVDRKNADPVGFVTQKGLFAIRHVPLPGCGRNCKWLPVTVITGTGGNITSLELLDTLPNASYETATTYCLALFGTEIVTFVAFVTSMKLPVKLFVKRASGISIFVDQRTMVPIPFVDGVQASARDQFVTTVWPATRGTSNGHILVHVNLHSVGAQVGHRRPRPRSFPPAAAQSTPGHSS